MSYINQLTEYSLKNLELLDKINTEAQEIIYHFMAPEAFLMAFGLEQRLKELTALEVSAPQVFAQYKKVLIQLKFVSLWIWDNDAYLDLMKNNLADILGSEIDINERMTGKFYSVPDLFWPEIAMATAQALKENNQPLGNQQLIIAGDTAPYPPLVKYWILDYIRLIGVEENDILKRVQYFSQSQNFKKLNETDKFKVKQLIELYCNLLPQSLEEQTGLPEYKKELPTAAPAPIQSPIPPIPAPPPSATIAAAPPVTQPTQDPANQPIQKDLYREPVAPQNLNTPQTPKQPEPKLDGNVVNLRNLDNNQ